MASNVPLLLPCRLCEPYITQELVYSTFGQQLGQEVANRSAGGCRRSKHTKPCWSAHLAATPQQKALLGCYVLLTATQLESNAQLESSAHLPQALPACWMLFLAQSTPDGNRKTAWPCVHRLSPQHHAIHTLLWHLPACGCAWSPKHLKQFKTEGFSLLSPLKATRGSPLAFADEKMLSTTFQMFLAVSQAGPSTASAQMQSGLSLNARVPVFRFLEEYQTKRFRLKPAFASEQQIVALEARPGSPEALVEEFTRIREGLLELRHNVVLLRCNEDPDAFYPVSFCRESKLWPRHAACIAAFEPASPACRAMGCFQGRLHGP